MPDFKGITIPDGFRAAAASCGLKPSGRPDLALIVADRRCAAAGMFTTNEIEGAPVTIGRRHLVDGRAQAIVCNSGIANVGMGARGIRDALAMCKQVADGIKGRLGDILPCSTGLIGSPLPMDKIGRGIAGTLADLRRGRDVDQAAARAILTTDLVPKGATEVVNLSGRSPTNGVHIAGMAKGSGMIAPNMATMLCFLTTDAAITPAALRRSLRTAINESFNRISIDQDTSTSDAVLILASGAAGSPTITTRGRMFGTFTDGLSRICHKLARQIVADGEGATKVFRVVVKGARSDYDADLVGRTVVGSPLVKTAVHGSDPNWGRLLMAVGRSGASVIPDRLSIHIGDQCVFRRGRPVAWPKRTSERQLVRIMKKPEVTFTVDLGQGPGTVCWLGCDLSREYIRINADYRT